MKTTKNKILTPSYQSCLMVAHRIPLAGTTRVVLCDDGSLVILPKGETMSSFLKSKGLKKINQINVRGGRYNPYHFRYQYGDDLVVFDVADEVFKKFNRIRNLIELETLIENYKKRRARWQAV